MAVGRKIKPYNKISPLKNLRTEQRNSIRDNKAALEGYKDDFSNLPTDNLAANYQNTFAGAQNSFSGAPHSTTNSSSGAWRLLLKLSP